MATHRNLAASAFIAALFSAIYTAWAEELGFHVSNVWVLLAAAVAATTTSYAMTLAVWGLEHLRNRRRPPFARQ